VLSPDNQSQQNRGIDWPAVARTLLIQVLVLLALAGAFVGYVSWSSEASWQEFIEASQPSAREPAPRPQYSTPVRAFKEHATCDRKD
jgi:hypothetical protein